MIKQISKIKRRHNRVRSKIAGTLARPRLAVFRSNKQIFAQLIDDDAGKTLVAVSATEVKKSKAKITLPEGMQKFRKVSEAYLVGKILGEKALTKKINVVAFDRGGNRYTGRIKAIAEGARVAGLKF
ncbi:MAG: 50S ribosomal protein L18 [Patescibacteria group bacterium]